MLVLVEFSEDLYYASLNGLFVTTTDKLNRIFDQKPEVYMGECAGKHSEVQVTLDSSNLTAISTDQTFIQSVQKAFGVEEGQENDLLGSNPLGDLEDEGFFDADDFFEDQEEA